MLYIYNSVYIINNCIKDAPPDCEPEYGPQRHVEGPATPDRTPGRSWGTPVNRLPSSNE